MKKQFIDWKLKYAIIICSMSIWSGTGHRPDKLGGYDDSTFAKLVDLAEAYMELHEPPEYIISGMALGWDQALAQAAINSNIPLIAAVPFPGQEKMWPPKSVMRYHKILNQAKDIVYVSGEYSNSAMQKRNMWMVDKLESPDDILLALWDGSSGGTANCISYARKKRVPIVNLWEIYKEL